ncbi:MAG: methionyl-tRNA formyltransferase, partial [Patescibacteria group bacterium]
AAYSKILPKEIIAIPRLGTIGVHPSLLPKYRGATPIQSAILNGEQETGVTLFLVDEKIDHGPILSSIKHQVSGTDTYKTLMRKSAELAGDLLIKTLAEFVDGKIKPRQQNETEATYTKKFTTADAFVDLEKDEPVIMERKIRAFDPEPGTWTLKNGKRIKILKAEIVDGKLKLRMVQEAGKKPKEV